MRKFIYGIVLAAGLSGALASCNGFLDQTPTNAVAAEKAMQNISDAGVACNGFYTPLKYYSMYGTYFSLLGDLRSDAIYMSKQNKNNATMYQFDYDETQNSYFGSIWGGYYEVINRCNTFLENITPLRESSSATDQKTIDNYIGEAYAVRGFCYFDLARFYGYPYTKDNGASLGAVIVGHTISTSEALGMERSTVAETYKQAIDDMEKALTLVTKEKNSGHFNYWATEAMLAKIYLFKGDNEKAYQYATDVINKNGNLYKLCELNDYKEYWGHDGLPETLLEFFISLKGDIDSDGGFYTIYHNLYFDDNGGVDSPGRSLVPTKKWRDAFIGHYKDVRYTMLEDYDWGNGDHDMWLRKFLGNKDLNFTFRRNSPKILRMSDVYLMAAEAAVKIGGKEKTDAAATYLHDVRSRREEGVTKIDSPTLDDILNERFKEFIGEGHRFFDLMRNGKTIVHDADYDPQDYVGTGVYKADGKDRITWDYYKIVLPIATSEIGIYPGLQQNPGYKGN